MARGVRLTKAERQWLVETLAPHLEYAPKVAKLAASIIAKVEASEMPVAKATGLPLHQAMSAFHEVLGRRLILPPHGAPLWGQLGRRVAQLGLSRSDCVTVAKVAAAEWRGAIKAESLIRQADKLLAASQQSIDWEPPGGWQGAAAPPSPAELQDDDL